MAPMTTPRRRSLSEVDSFDDDGDDDDPLDNSSSRIKRARKSAYGVSAFPLNTPNTNGYHHTTNGLQKERLHKQGSQSKYTPGSIVKVKLENFVTYTAVEFCPGPNLNMVIGPNGTGKSTLVCAICIGLGWGPQYLGRAKEVSEFVKHGCQEAMIEIELAKDGKRFKRNILIRCIIKKDGNRTIYSVNGENKSKKATVELARSLSIQIDNLCQFLPQDKVVEFAAMTPVDLLKSTQRAVGDQDMIETHETLKERRREQKELDHRIDDEQATLANLEGRQRLQEADVQRMRERESIEKHVSYMKDARVFAEYREARITHNDARDKRKAAQTELKSLRDELEPSLRAITRQQVYKDQCVAACESRLKDIPLAEKRADKINDKYLALLEQDSGIDAQIEAEKKGISNHKKEIVRVLGNIARLQKQMEDPEPQVDAAGYNEKIREKQHVMREQDEKVRALQVQQNEINRQGQEISHSIQAAEKSIDQLESQSGKLGSRLKAMSRDTFAGWSWLQEHKGDFEAEVYGPPIIECSVKDPKYVDLIESLFQRNLMLSFTVQTKKDFAKLSGVLHDQLRLSEVNIKTISHSLDYFRDRTPREDKTQYGFDSWALDHVQGPDPVMAMLCAEIKLHETGVALADTSEQQFELLRRSQLASWVTTKSLYRITRRREYGPGATSTNVRDVKPARIWTDQPVDQTAKREIQERIQALTEQKAELISSFHHLRAQIASYREAYNTNQEEVGNLTAEKTAKQKALGVYRTLPTKLGQEESKRDDSQKAIDTTKEKMLQLYKSKDEIVMQRAQLALSYVNAVDTLGIAHSALHEAELMSIEATSDLESLKGRNESVNGSLAIKEKELADFEKVVDTARETARKALARCTEIFDGCEPERGAFLRNLDKDQSVQDIDNEIEAEKARLELMHEGNGSSVIREFETRRKKIEALASKVAEYQTAKEELDAAISNLQNEWEPRLDTLVAQISSAFSYNMQQINCAGEVSVGKDDDFDQWSIQIRVKFRESEPMTVLDSHRQSGGERAVSTIFYLMSLQSLTRSPFRIVDEINQGMDPRNERLVHKRMVQIACGDSRSADGGNNGESSSSGDFANDIEGSSASQGGSQYFLITPKLLSDLEYARGMQVLCIASGEYMPSDRARIDFKGCLNLMRGLKGLNGQGSMMKGRRAINAGEEESISRLENGRVGIAAG